MEGGSWSSEPARIFRKGKRDDGGTLRRFESVAPHADQAQASLDASSPAVLEGRTLFPSTVEQPDAVGRVLVSGHNNPKLGRRVMRGAWAGMPLLHLTLEERATCPRSCAQWRSCYGNAMHLARRHAHGPALERRLGADLTALALEHPRGFVVRLHTLGDFYSAAYAARWAIWLGMHPELRIFGFTAHARDSEIGRFLAWMNAEHPTRCAIRFSRAGGASEPMGAATIWRQAEAPVLPEGIVCPAQTGARECCGTCGLCWAQGARGKTIVFVGHGMRRRGREPAPRETAPREKGDPMSEKAAPWPEGKLQIFLAMAPPKAWSKLQWETVCRLSADGTSYRVVATTAGLSHNAVIGIGHRRGFPARPSPILPKGYSSKPRAPKPPAQQRDRLVNTKRKPMPVLAAPPPAPRVEAPRRVLAPREAGTCRYPFGEVGEASFRFCEAAALAKSSYCPEHHARCYTRTPAELQRAADVARQVVGTPLHRPYVTPRAA